MNGAELKVTLGGLGIPPSWFAESLNVTMRTVVRWFDGDTIPETAHEELRLQESRTLKEMRKLVNANKNSTEVVLKTYRVDDDRIICDGAIMPASWHRALVFRVAEHLRAQGKTVTVEYA